MPSNSRIVIAAAGSGKTHGIVASAIEGANQRALLVTFTNNNTEEIRRRLITANGGVLPGNVKILTWFKFLLHQCVKPYQKALWTGRSIDRIHMVDGKSTQYAKKEDVKAYYLDRDGAIYTDKIAQFAVEVDKVTDGLVLLRLSRLFDRIYVDELQDLAGYDLDLLDRMLRARIPMTMVGDIRQTTFTTSANPKNKQFKGSNIIGLFKKWEKAGLVTIEHEVKSRRCRSEICAVADRLFDHLPMTVAVNDTITGHDGVFVVRRRLVVSYLARHSPICLRYNKSTQCGEVIVFNYGAVKGLEFDRVLIFPITPVSEFVKTGRVPTSEETRAKLYVAITRARQSVAFVHDDDVGLPGIRVWEEEVKE